MSQSLAVCVPGPAAAWRLAVDEVVHPVNGPVPVAPGQARVMLVAHVPLHTGVAVACIECLIEVPPGCHIQLKLPLINTSGLADLVIPTAS